MLGPPARGGIWVADEGCCDNDTHHRRGLLAVDGNQVVPQRFAIDWMMLDRRHRAWVGDPARLSSYLSYGQPPDRGGRRKGRDSPATARPNSTAAARSNTAVGPGAPRQSSDAAHRAGDLPDLCAHDAGLGPSPRRRARSSWPGCWGGSVTAATRPRHTSISRSRSRPASSATACRSSLTASDSWARSPSRSRTRTSACGPTESCPLPQPVGRVHAATRCRFRRMSCDFREDDMSRRSAS